MPLQHLFKNKTEALRYYTELLKTLKEGEAITDPDALARVAAVFAAHPSSQDKLQGQGVKAFQAGMCPVNRRNLAYYAVRDDGLEILFSPRKAISPPSPRAMVISAMRWHVALDAAKALTAEDTWCTVAYCAISKQVIDKDTCEVDHYPVPFAVIADAYLGKYAKLKGGLPPLTPYTPGRVGFEMASEEDIRDWQEFHRARATYRLLHRDVHRNLRSLELTE